MAGETNAVLLDHSLVNLVVDGGTDCLSDLLDAAGSLEV